MPDSTPVILYHDPADFDQLDGMTWDGRVKGRVGPGFARGGVPNGQGTLFWTSSDIRDRTDRAVAPLDTTNASVHWADDGRHLCGLARTAPRDVASQGVLRVAVPGGAWKDEAHIGSFSPAGLNAGGPFVAACGIDGDRAVVVQTGGQGLDTAEYWVVQLSTGRILWHRTPPSPTQLTVSRDGSLIVENHPDGRASSVYGVDGAVVATLHAWVSAFSWDGTLAVTSPTWTGGQVTVTRWRDGSVIWSGPQGSEHGYAYGVTGPGTSLAVGIRDPAFPQKFGFPPADLFVVGPDGTVTFQQKNIVLFPTL